MTHRTIALAAAAALGIGMISSNASFGADPADATGANPGMTGQTAPPNAKSTDVGPIGGEFALSNNGTGGDLRQAYESANDPDKFFLLCAAIDNQAEIQLAQLAQQKSQDLQVKQIAQQVQQDHQQAQSDLQTAAQQASVTIPTSTPMMKQQEMKLFQALSGKEFDQQYISHMRACHAKAVSEYQDVAQLAKNDQVKSYATKTLPTLQQHFQQVQQAATALGLPNTNEAQPAAARMSGETGSSNSTNQMNSPGRMNESGK